MEGVNRARRRHHSLWPPSFRLSVSTSFVLTRSSLAPKHKEEVVEEEEELALSLWFTRRPRID